MLKKLIHIQKDIFYSPTHNTFFRVEPTEQVDFRDYLLEISGHEEKIFEFLLCNYNNYVSKEELEQEFPECADPYDKTLDRLRRDKLEGRLRLYGLIKKAQGRAILYLSESPFAAEAAVQVQDVPLLCRTSDYVDYDRILSDCAPGAQDGDAPRTILHKWIRECEALGGYDEKCLLLLERIAFLPAFGRKADKRWFLTQARTCIYRFEESDVQRYGGTEMLLFARSVLLGVLEYMEAQLEILMPDDTGMPDLHRPFAHLLQRFRTITVPAQMPVNPLLLTLYYDYYGLVCYRNYLYGGDTAHLKEAVQLTEKALENARRVDMHLQIWASFLTYNLGRFEAECGEYGAAVRNIRTAVILRQGLAESPFFTESLRRDLVFEYLLARIRQVQIEQAAGLLTEQVARTEYTAIREEMQANAAPDSDNQAYIRRLLHEQMQDG